jgi:hypothetical protein
MSRTASLKVWAALLVAAVSAAIVVAIIGVALEAGTAQAATPTGATIEATQFKVPAGQTGEAFAVCPGTKRAVGGGVVQSGTPSFLFVRASGPLDATGITLNTNDGDKAKMWYAAVVNSTTTERTFKVFALCSGASKATIEATPLTVPNGQTGEAFAVCPGNKRALGGGVVQSGPASTGLRVRASGPLDATGFTSETITGDIVKQWYAAVSNNTGGSRDFKVFAICSGDSSAKIKATAFSVPGGGQTGEAFAKCASTKRALGGGVVQSGSAEGLELNTSGPLDATGVTLETKDGDIAKQWYAAISNFSSALREFKVFAICE